MKLLRYTHFNLSFLLFLLLGGWGTFFYYTVIDVSNGRDRRCPGELPGYYCGKFWRILLF